MQPITLSLTTFFLLFFFSVDVTTSFSPNDTLLNCSQTFNCGPLQNSSYPFTGGPRPPYCGPPGFHLTCPDDSPELTFESVSYRVLQLDQTHQNLTLARSDLSNTTCLHEFANSTLNFTIFSLGSDNEQLSLFYGCSEIMAMKPYNQFDCEINGSVSNSYSLVGPVPIDPILNVITCNVSVSVPILKTAADRLISNRSTLAQVLREGFSVNYSNPYSDHCEKCRHSDGECGFDSDLGKPICICGDRLCPEAKKKLSITLGTTLAGAGLAGIIVGCCIFYCIQRGKNAAAKSKSVALSSTVPSTNGVPAATNFSRSTRSYPSSNSDLEKGSTYFGVHVFSYTELEEATGNFDSSRELGEGGFGTVYYGKLQDGRVVAVKRLYENNFKRVEQFMNEVEILTRLQHENLVKLYGCTSKRSRELLLVYEYIPNGTVADHLHGNRAKSGLVSWPIRLSIAIETADALAYLHWSDIIHRDVKTNNILLDNNFSVKVADFGLSRLFPTDVTHVSTAPQGTPGYVDPEYYQCYQLTNKSDVYSFGVVLIELISSKQAVDTNRHRHDINLANMAINKIQNHTLHELVDPSLGFEKDNTVRRMTTLVAELAFQCLQQERDMRPSMEEVLKILRGIQSEEVDTQKAEVVDIRVEDVGQLRLLPPPLSPDSVATEKWASDSALPHSF